MCRYQNASNACAIAARRSEALAINASKITGRVEIEGSQVVREATGLIDEWVGVREGLGFAEEVLTLISQNPDAFEEFRRSVTASSLPASAPRREAHRHPSTAPAGQTVAAIVRAMRSR